jgi:hypothetical protein
VTFDFRLAAMHSRYHPDMTTKLLPRFATRLFAILAALAVVVMPGASRAQSDIPIYLPIILKPLAMVGPEWIWTSNCATTQNFEGSTPDGGSIGQVARKLAFAGTIPGAEGQAYTYQWVIDGDPNVIGGPVAGTIDNDGFVASGLITFGTGGACEDPQPPGVYEVRIVLDGKPFYTARLTITP